MPDPAPSPAAPAPAPAAPPANVPEWLDAQFVVRDAAGSFDLQASAAKQASSYHELRSRMSRGELPSGPAPTDPRVPATDPATPAADPAAEPAVPPTDPAAEPATDPAAEDTPISRATAHYTEHGELTPELYAELETAGITREMTDNYIAGVTSTKNSYNDGLYSAAGGQKSFDAAIAWAADNLTAAQADAFDASIESGNIEQAKLAVQGLMVQHQAAVGRAPTYTDASDTPTAGAAGYRSSAEVRTAMGDPRYKTDAAYREDVARRMAATPDHIA